MTSRRHLLLALLAVASASPSAFAADADLLARLRRTEQEDGRVMETRSDLRALGDDVVATRGAVSWTTDELAAQGVVVQRATLSQEPGKFVANEAVRAALEANGTGALPAIVVDGVLKSAGAYPAREQIAGWVGLNPIGTPVGAVLPMAATGGCCGGSGCC